MARMKIKAGSVETEDINAVKSEAGGAGLSALISKIKDFYLVKQHKTDVDNSVKMYNEEILNLMTSLKVDKIDTAGIHCSKATRVNKTVKENELLEYCKTLNIPGLVVTREVVDLDKLEDLVYKKAVDPDTVKSFYIESTSTYLRLSGKLIEGE